MTERERFHACMQYRPVDRAPICDFGFWDETIPLWHEQGLPAEVNTGNASAYFGMDEYSGWCYVRTGLCPGFEYRVLQDEGEYEVVQDYEGVISRRKKFLGSIPMFLGHTLVDRESWRKEFLPKLDPGNPERFPADWQAKLAEFKDPNRTVPLTFDGGSLYGWIRNWMGVEALSMVVYDEPAWFEEMVETIANLILGLLQKCSEAGIRFDNAGMWEDMCYSGGPLLSPEVYRRVCVPHYRRIADLLNRYGTEIVWVDCDGRVDQLVPSWLDAGINTLFPIEVGTWKSDPVAFRREYGRQLRLMGGFDKHILALTPAEIDAEIERLTPLVEEGGFIPFCDHRVPPDVPLANYEHYLLRVRQRWGRDLDLKPFRQLPPSPTDTPSSIPSAAVNPANADLGQTGPSEAAKGRDDTEDRP